MFHVFSLTWAQNCFNMNTLSKTSGIKKMEKVKEEGSYFSSEKGDEKTKEGASAL